MQSFGLCSCALLAGRERWAWRLAGLLAALVPALWMWGFTVDDALISVRYARHLAVGLGWRFDAGTASTDGVTPLPWPLILAPMARAGDALTVLGRAQRLGLLAWALTGAALGDAFGREHAVPEWARGSILAVLAVSVPLAAYVVSGMETALPTCLATFAALASRRPLAAAAFAGVAASFRPELAPWACVLAIGLSLASREVAWKAFLSGAVALTPFATCALIRLAVWGRPAPLALLAKPSDLHHGVAYAVAALVVSVAPILVLAPRALSRSGRATAIVAAAMIHMGVIVAVGGDWMPYARLLVPVLPSMAYAGVLAAAHASRVATAARSLVGLALGVCLLVRNGGEGRHVAVDRAKLISLARPRLRAVTRVAALDIGWVSAATEGDIVDMAGVTDPVVASLPGGHTSKRVGPMFLLGRDPDALLLYSTTGCPNGELSEWKAATYPRAVEARLARDEVISRHFTPAAWLPLGTLGAGYVLLLKRSDPGAP